MALTPQRFFVTNLNDSGQGSLRAAVIAANTVGNVVPPIEVIVQKTGKLVLSTDPLTVTSNQHWFVSLNKHQQSKCGKCKRHKSDKKKKCGLTITTSSVQNLVQVAAPCEYLKLEHFKFTGGQSADNGGAISVGTTPHELILNKCCVVKNSALASPNTVGGGIYSEGNVTLIKSSVIANVSSSQGGGIFATGSVAAYQSKIDCNQVLVAMSSSGGAGVYADDGNVIVSNHSSVSKNKAPTTAGSGGGIIVNQGDLHVEQCSRVNHNKSYNSAGVQMGLGSIYVTDDSEVSFNESFNSNTGAAGGGGISIIFGSVLVSKSKISHNKTQGMYSGGIVSVVGDVLITGQSEICGNTNNGPGGAIATNFNSSLVISGKSKLIGNTGSSLGGALVNFSLSNLGNITVTEQSVIENNTLTNGQTIGQTLAVFLSLITGTLDDVTAQTQVQQGSGGVALVAKFPEILAMAQQTQTAMNSLAPPTGQTSWNGLIGGSAIASLLGAAITVSKGSFVTNNTTYSIDPSQPKTNSLGGIFAYLAPVTLNQAYITRNKVGLSGGGVWAGNTAQIDQCAISGNEAGTNGGGMFLSDSANTAILNSVIEHNKAQASGGGVFNNGRLTMVNTRIRHNQAELFHNVFSSTPILQ